MPIAVAMELPGSKGNVFLDVQVFTGAMFTGGTVCMLLLRNWKTGANEREKVIEQKEKGKKEECGVAVAGQDTAAVSGVSGRGRLLGVWGMITGWCKRSVKWARV